MGLLDVYMNPLNAQEAAHLLRRTTAGPSVAEVNAFTGLTAQQAIDQLISNISLHADPPVNLDKDSPQFGQWLNTSEPFLGTEAFDRLQSVRFWWMKQMVDQSQPVSLLEKLALFWQNHFVVSTNTVTDYRFYLQYLQLIRSHALGNFRTFVKAITINAAMLEYLDGDANTNISPNENYARELQELFTVGERDYDGNPNYTENDIKEAAKVLTGWRHLNYRKELSTEVVIEFRLNRHDTSLKQFSSHYNNATIAGNNTPDAGYIEVDALIDLLLNHRQTARFICRKLYKWFVNPNVTSQIEQQVIVPLAQFFESPANNWAIEPVVRKLLTSEIFFDITNRGAIIKSPVEMVFGAYRYYQVACPSGIADPNGCHKYLSTVQTTMRNQLMGITEQESVFGYEPYYQALLSKGWLSSATLANRYQFIQSVVSPTVTITGSIKLGADLLAIARNWQPNFSDVVGTPAITAEFLVNKFLEHLLVFNLSASVINQLIDEIFMASIPRDSWIFEWNRYRQNPTQNDAINAVKNRIINLNRYVLRLAEFQLC
jgi:uncharacterized protein (DUF1800 family)